MMVVVQAVLIDTQTNMNTLRIRMAYCVLFQTHDQIFIRNSPGYFSHILFDVDFVFEWAPFSQILIRFLESGTVLFQ